MTSTTENPGPIPDLAALIWAVAAGHHSASARAEALLSRLGISEGGNYGAGVIQARLRETLSPADVAAESRLAKRITDTLTAARFQEYDPGNPVAAAVSGAFIVGAGVGATVRVSWRNMTADGRAAELLKYAYHLRRAGLPVDIRTGYLYVHENPPPPSDDRR